MINYCARTGAFMDNLEGWNQMVNTEINKAFRVGGNIMSGQIEMERVREYKYKQQVELVGVKDKEDGPMRLCLQAENAGGGMCTLVDLLDIISWVRRNVPELLEIQKP